MPASGRVHLAGFTREDVPGFVDAVRALR